MKHLAIATSLAVAVLGLGSLPAMGGTPAEVITDDVFVLEDAFNPCTGTDEDLVLTSRLVLRRVDTEDSHHILFTAISEAEQGDFSGRAATREMDNGLGSSESIEDFGTFSLTQSVVMRSSSGQVVNVHFMFHLTVANGVLHADDIDLISLECVGNPS